MRFGATTAHSQGLLNTTTGSRREGSRRVGMRLSRAGDGGYNIDGRIDVIPTI
jgi:hypothetical protein